MGYTSGSTMEKNGNDLQVQNENEATLLLPYVQGVIYAGEENPDCPTCGGRLMWYSIAHETEMLICSNVKCDYPFDEKTSYEIRPIDYDRLTVEGTHGPRQGETLAITGAPPVPQPSTSCGSGSDKEMSLEVYSPTTSASDSQVVRNLVKAFNEGERVPETQVFQNPYEGALRGVMGYLAAIDVKCASIPPPQADELD